MNTSLGKSKASGIEPLLLPISFLNVSDEVQRKLFVTGDTIVTYYPCDFDVSRAFAVHGLYNRLRYG